MTPFPLLLTDPVPEALPPVPEDKLCLIIILVIHPEQRLPSSYHLVRAINACAVVTCESPTLKLTINCLDQTQP
ncbi:MAG: hypothetical protein WAV05_00980 [Anaerolineales bacterium]